MSSSNGKGKAKDNSNNLNTSNTEPNSEEPSLLSRITASANGLTQSTFTAPSQNELNNQVASSLSSTGKGQSLSNPSGSGKAWAESSHPSLSAAPSPTQASGSSGLRTGHTEQHAQLSENEFSSFLDGIDSFVPSESFGQIPVQGQAAAFDDAWQRSQTRPLTESTTNMTVAHQEQHDGDDVLAILSNPSALENQLNSPPEGDDLENYDWGLSPAQLTQLREITTDILPAPEKQNSIDANRSLNLVPDFGHDVAARQQWMDEWEGVLTRYADEVWGGLLPLVKKARKELEDVKAGDGEESGRMKATRRLGAILGHMREG